MTKAKSNTYHTSRSQHIDGDRCDRLLWLGYYEGPEAIGVQPVRKSIHLVIGGAVHVGLETLLRQAREWLKDGSDLDGLFVRPSSGPKDVPYIRMVEDLAVEDALADLAASTRYGVELDMNEQPGSQKTISAETGLPVVSANESPLTIDFGDFDAAPTTFKEQLKESVKLLDGAPIVLDWFNPVIVEEKKDNGPSTTGSDHHDSSARDIEITTQANARAASGIDAYLKLELAALVEGMIRAYARRRLRPLLEQFEILEVEREGEWKLAEIEHGTGEHRWQDGGCAKCGATVDSLQPCKIEIRFQSRLDALMLDRQLNSLTMLSYKTAGQWDRRKGMEAEIDMQGLTEAVDVENRLGEAWRIIRLLPEYMQTATSARVEIANKAQKNLEETKSRIEHLVGTRIWLWLRDQPAPPRVLAVRYEYLIKGSRRQDDKDPEVPGRYVFDSIFVRAYSQGGITEADRRWAHSYTYYTATNQRKNLSWQTWKKAPIWKHMPIMRWIDLLDSQMVQPDAFDQYGIAMDALADQFIAPITVYRNDDDMRDMLEQLEAKEVRRVDGVLKVRAARGDDEKRSLLNRHFPQNRRSCVYPGKCSMYQLCYGPAEIRRDPVASELYVIKTPNHPIGE